MSTFKLILVPLYGIVIAACSSSSSAVQIPSPTPRLEGVNVQHPTEIPGESMEKQPDANVIFVKAILDGDGTWTFHVTVEHPDTGWEDYVDGWDVLTPDGTILKVNPTDLFTRLLLHPHQTEQPFTRSQSGIRIPEDVHQVLVRAHDLVDGFGGKEILIYLNATSGPGFEITRD